MNNRERGWPEDCRKCDLYDREKQDCGMRSVGSGTPAGTLGDGEIGGNEP